MWFIWWDVCGLLCYLFAEACIWFIDYVVVMHAILPMFRDSALGIPVLVAFQSLVAVVFVSHIRATISSPGCTEQNSAKLKDVMPGSSTPFGHLKPERRYCKKCSAFKPSRAHHCSICGRCVLKMDHHCPWMNNCVGQNNYKFFLLFIILVPIGCSIGAILIAWRGYSCYTSHQCGLAVRDIAFMAVGGIMAVFFTIFTIAMQCDQYETLTTDVTGVESMKQWDKEERTLWQGLQAVCGKPSLAWLLPTPGPEKSLWRHDPARDPDATDPRDPAAIEHFDWLLYVATNIAQWEAAQPNFKSPFRRTDDIPAPDRTILHEVWPTVPLKLSKRDDALLAEQLRRGLLFTTYDPRIYTFLNEARIEQYLIREEEQNRRRAAAASDLQGRVESSSDSGASDGDSAEANQQ